MPERPAYQIRTLLALLRHVLHHAQGVLDVGPPGLVGGIEPSVSSLESYPLDVCTVTVGLVGVVGLMRLAGAIRTPTVSSPARPVLIARYQIPGVRRTARRNSCCSSVRSKSTSQE